MIYDAAYGLKMSLGISLTNLDSYSSVKDEVHSPFPYEKKPLANSEVA